MSASLSASPEINRWHKDETATAFWDQHRALPYRELLADTVAWCDPRPEETWLDLGCGGGHLTSALWQASHGQVMHIHSTDCAPANQHAIARLCRKLDPLPKPNQITFSLVDFSHGLPQFADHSFDGIVSGLAISYAEAFDEGEQRYTDSAYARLYQEMFRVLRPKGRLVFSVNVPNPNFWRIVWKSFSRGVRLGKPMKTLKNVWQMQQHGSWLKREAKRGRFHFVPQPAIAAYLQQAGFTTWQSRLSYANQAYVVRADKT